MRDQYALRLAAWLSTVRHSRCILWGGLPTNPTSGEFGQDALGRAAELIAAQRLGGSQSTGEQQRLGERMLTDLGIEHDDAVAKPPTISALLQGSGRAGEHAL